MDRCIEVKVYFHHDEISLSTCFVGTSVVVVVLMLNDGDTVFKGKMVNELSSKRSCV
jgi:hypothetical protein